MTASRKSHSLVNLARNGPGMRNNGCEIALYNATKQIPVSPQRIGNNGNEGISVIVEYETQIGKNDGSIGEPIVWVNVGRNGLFRGAWSCRLGINSPRLRKSIVASDGS